MRPDRFTNAVEKFCRTAIYLDGNENVKDDGVISRTIIYGAVAKDEGLVSEPILLITTPGADPSQDLRLQASRIVGDDHFIEVLNYIYIVVYNC